MSNSKKQSCKTCKNSESCLRYNATDQIKIKNVNHKDNYNTLVEAFGCHNYIER